MLFRGIPENIRSDNGSEFVAEELRKWLAKVGTGTLYIEPGSLWENGYCESFSGKLRDECLNGEIFYSLKEAQIVIEKWRVQYNTKRPHSALGYRPPAPAACSQWLARRREVGPDQAPRHPETQQRSRHQRQQYRQEVLRVEDTLDHVALDAGLVVAFAV